MGNGEGAGSLWAALLGLHRGLAACGETVCRRVVGGAYGWVLRGHCGLMGLAASCSLVPSGTLGFRDSWACASRVGTWVANLTLKAYSMHARLVSDAFPSLDRDGS